MKKIKSQIIKGHGLGSKIGLPTINLNCDRVDLEYGVYFGEVIIDKKKYFSLIHFGPRKTFSNDVSLELLLLEWIDQILELKIEVQVRKKIRNIKTFSSSEELKKQIKKDWNQVKKTLLC